MKKEQTTVDKRTAASIAKANAAYRKATPAQRRVMIAKDAIKRCKAGQIGIVNGTFFASRMNEHNHGGCELREILHNPEFSGGLEGDGLSTSGPLCRVCAEGALFVSAVAFRNKCKLNKFADIKDNLTVKNLTEFSRKQIQLIEMAFEMGRGFFVFGAFSAGRLKERLIKKPTKEHHAAVEWAQVFLSQEYRHEGTDLRFIAIMKNIIKHKGQFNPFVK